MAEGGKTAPYKIGYTGCFKAIKGMVTSDFLPAFYMEFPTSCGKTYPLCEFLKPASVGGLAEVSANSV